MKAALAATILLISAAALAQPGGARKIFIDQDGSGPGGTDMLSVLALLQAPDPEAVVTLVKKEVLGQ